MLEVITFYELSTGKKFKLRQLKQKDAPSTIGTFLFL